MKSPVARDEHRSTAAYLQLAHKERHPVTGNPVAKVIWNFGREDSVDKVNLIYFDATSTYFEVDPDPDDEEELRRSDHS